MLYTFSLPQNINRNIKILAMNGLQFFLVDVIAHILHHLKDRLLTVLKDLNLRASDFDWVITVPAFWGSEGKEMMFEAGYMVSPNSNYKCVITREGLTCKLTHITQEVQSWCMHFWADICSVR